MAVELFGTQISFLLPVFSLYNSTNTFDGDHCLILPVRIVSILYDSVSVGSILVSTGTIAIHPSFNSDKKMSCLKALADWSRLASIVRQLLRPLLIVSLYRSFSSSLTCLMSIAAASVLAKVTRDRQCMEMDQMYPEYGFAGHKGYPTKAHKAKVIELGPCPEHRRSFLSFVEKEKAKGTV